VARHDIAARKLLLLGFGLNHEAMQVLVEQVAAIAPASFGHENPAWRKSSWMKLYGLHVAQRHDTRVEGNRCAGAFVDCCVGRVLAIDAAMATSCDDCGFGENGGVLTGTQAACDSAPASAVFVNQLDSFSTVTDSDAESNDPYSAACPVPAPA